MKETPRSVYRRALRQAIAETTHVEHEREHLYDEVEANKLELLHLVQMQEPSKIQELSEKLACHLELAEKFQHYCCQEYSEVMATGERFCVAPTVNYIKWSTRRETAEDEGEFNLSTSREFPKMRSLGGTPVAQSPRRGQRQAGEGDDGDEMAGTPAPEEEDTEYFDASSTMKSFAASPEWRSGGPPALSTIAQFNKKEERRRERMEWESSQAAKKAEQEKLKKERRLKLALRGPKSRPASASPKVTSPGPHKLKIDMAMEARAERRTELELQERHELEVRQQEERERKAKLKQMALRGPDTPVRPQRPKSASPTFEYATHPSPNRFVPSTSSYKPFNSKSDERAAQRAKFDEYVKEKEGIMAAREREQRVIEEKEAEREVKELRKAMEFKASPKPDFDKLKFSPTDLRYLEPKPPGKKTLKEHVEARRGEGEAEEGEEGEGS